MSGVRVEFNNTRVEVGCPRCGAKLSVGDHTGHSVVVVESGVNVDPDFSCSCDAIIRVRHGKVLVIDVKRPRSKRTVLPSTPQGEPRKAVRIEVSNGDSPPSPLPPAVAQPQTPEALHPSVGDSLLPEKAAPESEYPFEGVDITQPVKPKKRRG